MKRHRSHRRGYVLLVTLGLLVLSSTLLVATGRAAANHALKAHLEQNQLQQRWGAISCRHAILSHAEQILSSAEQHENRAVPEYRTTIQLGEDTFTLIVADEQAKANINLMIDQFGVQSAEDRIRQATSGSGLLNDVRLRPSLISDESAPPATQPAVLILGPGQMFNAVDPRLLIQPMQSLTCWGNGPLNVFRADQQSMRNILMPTLTQLEIARLIAARDQVLALSITSPLTANVTAAGNKDAIGSLLSQAKIDASKRNRLGLTGRSACHSLWLIAKDPRREWYSLMVSDESVANQPVVRSIMW